MTARDESSLHEQLSALLDGELPDAEARELRKRIETDPELRREFESLSKTVEAIRGLEPIRAPAALRERLRRRPRRPRPVFRLVTGVAAGLAAAAALVIALRVGLESHEPKDRFQEASAPEGGKKSVVGDDKRSGGEATSSRFEEADPETIAAAKIEAESKDADESPRFAQREKAGARAATEDAETALDEQLGRDMRKQPTAPAAPLEKSLRPAAEERANKEATTAGLAMRVASGGLVASEPERNLYLAELSKLERKELSTHFAALESRGRRGFAATPGVAGTKKSKSKTKAKPPAPVAAEAEVTGRNEAMLIREILRRAFPAQETGGGGQAGQPEIQLGARTQELYVDLDLTPDELTQVHAWLDILKDSRRGSSRPASAGRERPREGLDVQSGVEPTKRGAGPVKRPVRVRLIYAPRPAAARTPEPEAKQNPADDR